jgi:cytochrome c oxidase subunit 1
MTTQNPWGANTLEWTAPIHPGHGNWPGNIPTVHRWAYDYSKEDSVKDFIQQHIPLTEKEKAEQADH